MDNFSFRAFENRDRLHLAASELCAETLRSAQDKNGQAVFVGAGGTTPAPIYSRLRKTDLSWSNVTIGLTDERWTSPGRPGSNAQLISEALLQGPAAAARFLPLVRNTNTSLEEAVETANATYRTAMPDCDLMVLGMGEDAHTLSWFPGSDGVEFAMAPDADKWVAAIDATNIPAAGNYPIRLTLTASAVASAKTCLLVITGAKKRKVLETSTQKTPIKRLAAISSAPILTYWAP
ncbi:MAG: 6-phosphogluconolactonase [Pseudomonadota bacterium]